MKVELIKQNVDSVPIPRDEIIQYPDFRVFGIYRDPKEKVFSVFKDFTKSDRQMRLDQMRSLFGIKALSLQDIRALSFSEFLDLAILHKDHHWSPNFPYLFLPDVPVTLFKYHTGVMAEVEEFLGFEINRPPLAVSSQYVHDITSEEEEKIHQLMKIDYENMDYFLERIVNMPGDKKW